MKFLKNILFKILIWTIVISCDTEGGIDDDAFVIAGNAPIASWITSAEGSDLLKLSDTGSPVPYEIEFIDASNGNSVNAFTMTVSDNTSSGVLISQTTFTANADGIQGFSGSFSLNDVFSALGTTASDYKEGDKLNFTHTVTSGGVDYPGGNSNTFSNSIRDFSLEIPVETVDLVIFSSDSVFLNANSRETITMTFENDFTNELVVLPAVTRMSAKGQTDDVIGDVTIISDVDDADSVYTFTYAPGASDVDTISFIISDASALSSGFVMANDTFNTVFIIDNIDPAEVADISSLQTDGNTDTTGFRFNILFSEDIGDLTITSNFIDVDDDLDGEIDEEGESTTVSATFSGSNLDYTFPWIGSEDGEVELTLEVKDRAGNILDYGIYRVLE